MAMGGELRGIGRDEARAIHGLARQATIFATSAETAGRLRHDGSFGAMKAWHFSGSPSSIMATETSMFSAPLLPGPTTSPPGMPPLGRERVPGGRAVELPEVAVASAEPDDGLAGTMHGGLGDVRRVSHGTDLEVGSSVGY